MKAIEELQGFLDYFPRSDKVTLAQNAIFELQDKLTLKELQNAQLYYNLGTYMGNNYESAIITARNAIKEYPYSKYKEELEMLVLKSRYQEANLRLMSVRQSVSAMLSMSITASSTTIPTLPAARRPITSLK